MWAAVIVDSDDFCYTLFSIVNREITQVSNEFVFENAVNALRYTVFSWVSVFGHARLYPLSLQCSNILASTVLRTSVGMMDKRLLGLTLPQRHLKSCYCIDSKKVVRILPTDYLLRVGIGDEEQKPEFMFKRNVGYVANPYLICTHWYNFLY